MFLKVSADKTHPNLWNVAYSRAGFSRFLNLTIFTIATL